MFGLTALITFIATIPAANWLIGHVGTACLPDGPCVVPVGFGLYAPSGVLMIGLALVMRDIVQRQLGATIALLGVLGGAALSWTIAPPSLAVASGVAFLLSELADFAIYTPLYRRQLIVAVIFSGIAGAIIDSAVFLHVAFGSLQFLPGQVLGKIWMIIAATPLVALARRFQPQVTK